MILLDIVQSLKDLWNDPSILINPETLIHYGGLFLIVVAVYAQTGIFVFFFIPGDALLFTAGVFVASGDLQGSIVEVCSALALAAFAGNITGYWVGRKTGPVLFSKKDSLLFKKKYLIAAQSFYSKYGNLTLTIGLFFVIIRTFASIIAGFVKMSFKRFLMYAAVGSVVWVVVLTGGGFFLGRIPFVQQNIQYFFLILVCSLVVPVSIRFIRNFFRKRNTVR